MAVARTRHRLWLAGVIALVSLAADGAEAAQPRRVAVIPLRNLGVDEDVAASLLGFLRSEVARLPGVALVDSGKVARIMRAECRVGEVKCLAAAGQKVDADEMVFGTVAGVGDAYSIDLKRVLVRGAREQNRITERLSGESDQKSQIAFAFLRFVCGSRFCVWMKSGNLMPSRMKKTGVLFPTMS
jgi:hypothetical protein